jgi:hypothetical protein
VVFYEDSFPLAVSPSLTGLDFLCESGRTVSTIRTHLTTAGTSTPAPCRPAPQIPPGFEPPVAPLPTLAVSPGFLPRAATTAAPHVALTAPPAVTDGPPPRTWSASPVAYVWRPQQPAPVSTTPPPPLPRPSVGGQGVVVPVTPPENPHRMITRDKTGFKVVPDCLVLTAVTSSPTASPIPSARAALVDPYWHATMVEEYGSLISNGTWELVLRPQGSNVVTGKWVFTHKLRADETLDRYKARWVLQGFTQRPGVNYDETFSSVVKPAIVCTVLATVVSRDWPIQQLDVKNAFLHSTISETVFCCQPMGFVDPTHPDLV